MHHRWVCVALIIWAGTAVRPVPAAEKPLPALTRLVGDDAGLCIEMHQLAAHRQVITGSEMFLRLRRSAWFQQLQNLRPYQRGRVVRERLEQLAGKPLGRLLDELFGQEVVLAVYPRVGKSPAGILLTRALNPQVLQEALTVWNRAEPRQVSQPKMHRGVRYVRRQSRPAGKGKTSVLYYVILNDVFALSDREEMILKTIELAQPPQGEGASSSLSDLPRYQAAKQSLRGHPVITVFLNPRRWESPRESDSSAISPRTASSAAKASAGVSDDLPVRFWNAAQWLMAGVRWEEGPVVETCLSWDPGKLPEGVTDSLGRIAGPPDFLKHVPAGVLVACAGRWDPVGVSRLLKKLFATSDETDLHRLRRVTQALLQGVDVIDELLPRLKPNGGFYLIERKTDNSPRTGGNRKRENGNMEGDDNDVPLDGLLGLEWSSGGRVAAAEDSAGNEPKSKTRETDNRRLEQGLSHALQFLATLYNINSPPAAPLAVVRQRREKGMSLYWIDSVGGWKPAVALSRRYLLLAGSPERIADFHSGSSATRLVQQSSFRRLQQRLFPRAQQLVYIDTARLRNFLQQYNKELAVRLAASRKHTQPHWEHKLNAVREGLSGVDTIFVAAEVEKTQLRLTAGLLAFPPSR